MDSLSWREGWKIHLLRAGYNVKGVFAFEISPLPVEQIPSVYRGDISQIRNHIVDRIF
jgi:hypothetical protein